MCDDDPEWGREDTRFTSRPRTTDDVAFGFEVGRATPVAQAMDGWQIAPDEFDAEPPVVHTDDEPEDVAATPLGSDPEEFVRRLRRGDFTDPSIRLDEFDDLADTMHVDSEDLDTSWFDDARSASDPEHARQRAVAQAFLEEISDRIRDGRERRGRLGPEGRAAADAVLRRHVERGDTARANRETRSRLSGFLGTEPEDGLSIDALLRGYLDDSD